MAFDFDFLTCPITHNMFIDPVMVIKSGHTYERVAIQKHFDMNGYFDPITRIPCRANPTLIPNHLARMGVHEYLERNPEVIPDGWEKRELALHCGRLTVGSFKKQRWGRVAKMFMFFLVARFAHV